MRECIDCNTSWEAPVLNCPKCDKPGTDYAALEREHFGDPEKKTGIYHPDNRPPSRSWRTLADLAFSERPGPAFKEGITLPMTPEEWGRIQDLLRSLPSEKRQEFEAGAAAQRAADLAAFVQWSADLELAFGGTLKGCHTFNVDYPEYIGTLPLVKT
jgi:hypothetical protein